jgi:hypothetical protein
MLLPYFGSVLEVEITAQPEQLTSVKTRACGLRSTTSLHIENTTPRGSHWFHREKRTCNPFGLETPYAIPWFGFIRYFSPVACLL